MRMKPGMRRNGVITLVALFALFVGVGALVSIVTTVTEKPPYAPLEVLPIEPVLSHVDGIAGPATHNGEDVISTSRKCNSDSKAIQSRSVKDWTSITPGIGFNGFDVTSGNGVQGYEPGCHDYTYHNPMPAAVEARNTELFAAGATSVSWRLSATETPVKGGKPQTWISEVFLVVP